MIFLAAGLAAFVLPSSEALGADVTWATASDGNWTNGADWAGGIPPANTTTNDTARFDDTGTYTVTLDEDRSVRNVNILTNANPVFDFTGYTLTVGNITRTYNDAVATLIGGTISGSWYQGYNGGNNSLFTITGTNAHVVASNGLVGYGDGSATNNLNILVISNGASFTDAGTFMVGRAGQNSAENAQANSNKVIVTGVDSTFGASGGIRIGTFTGGTNTNTGIQVSGNEFVIDDGATVDASQVRLGYIVSGSGASLTNNTLTIGGTGATATLNLSASSSLLIGSHDGGNAVIINTGGIINATNGGTYIEAHAGNTLRVNGGTLNATGRLVNVGDNATMFLGSNGVVNAGIVNIATNARFGDKSDAANAGFTSGTLNVSNLTNRAAVVFSVGDNSGTNPAILNLVGTNIHEFKAGITIEQSDGQLTGNGTIRGIGNTNTTLTVNGAVSPGNSVGKISVTGNLVSGSEAVYNFEIAGTLSFDELYVSGNAGFDGTLNITLLDSYMPALFSSFKLFDFSSSSGSFATLNLAPLSGGKFWDTSSFYSTGTISVIPEPSSALALMVFGALAALLRRKRN